MARILTAFCLALFSSVYTASADAPPITIGATLAVSGKLAMIGSSEFEGLSMAFDETNAKGGVEGRKIQFIIEDNQGDPKSGVSGAQKLLEIEKVNLFISAFTHITQAVKHLPARTGKTMIYLSAMRSIAAENPLFFRDLYDMEAAARRMAHYAAARGIKETVYLREDGEACTPHEKVYHSEAGHLGIQTLARDEITSGATDFRPSLLRLAAKKPQAFVLCTWRDAATVMRQLAELGLLGIPTLQVEAPALPVADTPEMRKLYEINKTVTTWYGYVETTKDPSILDFISRYRTRFRHTPTPDALLSYELGYAIVQSLEGCSKGSSVDEVCFRNNLGSRTHKAPTGSFSFDAERSSVRPVPLMRVDDGKWVEIKE